MHIRNIKTSNGGINLNLNNFVSGETKPSHPITRTSSDRRPDAVREETSKNQDNHDHSHDKHEEDAANTEG